jgi:hypothetical protein
MNLSGLKVRRSLRTFIIERFDPENISSAREKMTIIKSSMFHESLKYEVLSRANPFAITFIISSNVNIIVNTISNINDVSN